MKTLPTWLDEEEGRAKAMAAHFQITKSAVSQWRLQVPPGRMRDVRDYTKGEVDFEDMLPGSPPAPAATVHPSPGAPDDRRSDDRRNIERRHGDRRGIEARGEG